VLIAIHFAITPPVAALLAICELGSLPAGADTAKRFETDVAAVFGACEKTWSGARSPRTEGMGKNVSTVVKDTPKAPSRTVQILDRYNQKAAQNMSCQNQRIRQKRLRSFSVSSTIFP